MQKKNKYFKFSLITVPQTHSVTLPSLPLYSSLRITITVPLLLNVNGQSSFSYLLKVHFNIIQNVKCSVNSSFLISSEHCCCPSPQTETNQPQWQRRVKWMFTLFHASSSHPPLTTTSSPFRVRNKGEVQVESEKKEKKKNHRYLVPPFSGFGSLGVKMTWHPLASQACSLTGHLSGFFLFFFQLEDNCFIILWWFLP